MFPWPLLLTLASAATPTPANALLLLEPFTLPIPNSSIPFLATPFNSTSLGTKILFTSPSGRIIPVFPYFTQDFSRTLAPDNTTEVLTPTSNPYFAARLAPQEEGLYTYTQDTPPSGVPPINGNFSVAGGPALAGDGFAFASTTSRKFTLDNNTAFFLVGENMAWPGCWPYFNGSAQWDNATGATFMYDRYLRKLASAGGNWIRLWVGPSLVRDVSWDGEEGSFLPLALASYSRFGSYNLEAAWRIEYVVELCRTLGIKISMVLETSQCLSNKGSWAFWDACYFNAANGGPLSTPEEVFTNPASLGEFAARATYLVARWGYSTSIFSWELQNEADDWAGGYTDAALAASLGLSSLLHSQDPYGHMVDNSFGGTGPSSGPIHDFEADPGTAFTSVHAYNMGDVAASVWGTVTPHSEGLGKPCFMEEFGSDWRGPYQHQDDPLGVGMHTGAWASLVGLGAGTAMQWFWAETDTLGTYGRLTGAATLSRALAAPLFQLHWSIWNGALNSTRVLAGWSVGTVAAAAADDAPEPVLLKGVLAWVYNRNYTQGSCGKGCVLDLGGEVVALSLLDLPTPPPGTSPRVQFINTTTGTALAEGGVGQGEGGVFVFPPFNRDCAMWVEWV